MTSREEKIDRIIKKLIKLNLVNLQKLESLEKINYESVCKEDSQENAQARQAQNRKAD